MKNIIESLIKWESGGSGHPTQAQIHLTNFCNLKCFFCPTRALIKELDKKKELSVEEWLKIIEDGNRLGIEEWHICGGGEPLFFKDIFIAVIEKIKKSGCRGELITNGTLFYEELIKKMVELKWDKIFFSLDSPFAETQNELRGVDCFNKIIKNVRSFAKCKKENDSTLPILSFHMVVCNKNYKQIPKMIELAKKLDVQDVLLNALNIWKPEINKLRLNETQEKELEIILNESKKLAEELNIDTNINEFLRSELFKKANIMNEVLEKGVKRKFSHGLLDTPCYYPWYNISIFADGTVQPCFIPRGKGEQIRGKNLKDIWFGKVFSEIREEMKKGKLSKYCAKCNPWNFEKMNEIRNKLRKIILE